MKRRQTQLLSRLQDRPRQTIAHRCAETPTAVAAAGGVPGPARSPRYRSGMKLNLVARVAKRAIDQRGGTAAVKQDIGALRKIAKGEGSFGTKAGRATAALRSPPKRPADDS